MPELSPRWGLALAAGLAAMVAAMVLGPAFTQPNANLVCNYTHPDCLSNHWLLVWVAEQAGSGASLLHNDRYYWPVGDAPWLAGNGSEGLFYLPFHTLMPWPMSVNAYLWVLLTLNGVSAYTLCRAFGVSPAAALPAATTGAALVYVASELGAGRYSQASICWLLFFLSSWRRLLEVGGVRRGVLAGCLFAITALFYWYYAFFGVLLAGLLSLRHLPKLASRGAVSFGITSVVLVGPLLSVFMVNWAGVPGTDEALTKEILAKDGVWASVPFLVQGGRHPGSALPLTVCVLAVAGLWHTRKRDGPALLAVALGFAALMAGPLWPGGPFELIYGATASLRRFWWPYRHVLGVNIALIVLAAWGLQALPRFRTTAGVLLALSTPAQLSLQRAPWRAEVSPVSLPHPAYVELAKQRCKVVIEPPLSPSIPGGQTHLIYQLFHQKQMLRGHAMRVDRVRPDAWDAFVAGNSVLAGLQAFERGANDTIQFSAADMQALINAGATCWVLDREHFPASETAMREGYRTLFTTLFGAEVLHVGGVRAWDARAWTGVTELGTGGFTKTAVGGTPIGPVFQAQKRGNVVR